MSIKGLQNVLLYLLVIQYPVSKVIFTFREIARFVLAFISVGHSNGRRRPIYRSEYFLLRSNTRYNAEAPRSKS